MPPGYSPLPPTSCPDATEPGTSVLVLVGVGVGVSAGATVLVPVGVGAGGCVAVAVWVEVDVGGGGVWVLVGSVVLVLVGGGVDVLVGSAVLVWVYVGVAVFAGSECSDSPPQAASASRAATTRRRSSIERAYRVRRRAARRNGRAALDKPLEGKYRPNTGAMGLCPSIKSAGRILGVAAGMLLVALGLGEGALRVAALFARDRATAWQPQARYRVLCVGDSHTFGFMVPSNETYPAYLQEFLDARAPGLYSVINLGIPGLNTAQLRHRLPDEIATYQPDVVVVWCGTNNAWNQAEVADEPGLSSWFTRALNASRLYRFVRVGLHDVRLERDFQTLGRDLRSTVSGRLTSAPEHTVDDPWNLNATHTIRHWDGSTDRVSHKQGADLDTPRAEERAAGDLAAMAEQAHAAGVKLVFVTYPTELPAFAFANRATSRAGAQYGVPVVDAAVSLQRVPPEDRHWLPAVHPNGPIYREIARDIAEIILQRDGATER